MMLHVASSKIPSEQPARKISELVKGAGRALDFIPPRNLARDIEDRIIVEYRKKIKSQFSLLFLFSNVVGD